MEITFLVSNYAPSVGGAQTHVRRVAEGLVHRHGHRVNVLTTDALRAPGGPKPGRVAVGKEWADGVLVERLPVARRTHSLMRTFRRLGRRVGVVRAARQTPAAVGPLGLRLALAARRAGRTSDVVVGVAAPYLTLLGADRGTRGTASRYVAMPLLHLTEAPQEPWVVRSLRRADGCVSFTTHERAWMVERGMPEERSAVLPPGCDPARYPDLTPTEARSLLGLPERSTVGYVGRLAAYKGIDTLLEAAATLWRTRPETNVLIAGNPAGWDGFEALLEGARSAAGDRLIVRSSFADDEGPILLAACDVIAFPSRAESFGMVSLEAWCARRPVVAGDIAAVRCLIRSGHDGELVPTGDAAALASVVSGLLDDPARCARYGAAGRRRAESEFSWDHVVDGWARFLTDTVERPRSDSRGAQADR